MMVGLRNDERKSGVLGVNRQSCRDETGKTLPSMWSHAEYARALRMRLRDLWKSKREE